MSMRAHRAGIPGPRVLAGLLAAAAPMAALGDGPVTVRELASDFSWGYQCGVKQPLGSYQSGWSVHELVQSIYPAETKGNPDNLLWVDEINDVHGIALDPTGDIIANWTTPGGMVAFSADGTLWFTHGARPTYPPLNLYASVQPYDLSAFDLVVPNYAPVTGSTTPCVAVHDPWVFLYWRNGHSGSASTTARVTRYDVNGTFAEPDLVVDLGQAMEHETLGRIGIEQLWPRHDPRFGYTFATWQFFRIDLHEFGSLPFLYTDDDGVIWRTADGNAWTQLPVHYAEITDVLVPYDHLALGDTSNWLNSDLGVSPNGVFWMTVRSDASGSVLFYRFDGEAWTGRTLAEINECKPFACGVSRDHIAFVYADPQCGHALKVRLSDDDGATWSGPIVVDDTGPDTEIAWVSFVQPADGYPDNHARFFYSYARTADGVLGLRYQNSVRWVRLDTGGLRPGDVDGDGFVGVTDFLELLAAWGPCADCADCPADLDGDATVGVTDFLELLANWVGSELE